MSKIISEGTPNQKISLKYFTRCQNAKIYLQFVKTNLQDVNNKRHIKNVKMFSKLSQNDKNFLQGVKVSKMIPEITPYQKIS